LPSPLPPPDPSEGHPPVHRRDRIGRIVAWAVIAISVGVIATEVQQSAVRRDLDRERALATGDATALDNSQLQLTAKYAVGVGQMMKSLGQPPPANLAGEIQQAARTPADQLAVVPVIAEVAGKDEALAALERLSPRLNRPVAASGPSTSPATTQVAATQPILRAPPPLHPNDEPIAAGLHVLYLRGPDALSPSQKSAIIDRLGWTGRLAMTHDVPDHPDRPALESEAVRLAITLVVFGIAAVGGVVVGLILLILAIVLVAGGKLSMRYQIRDPAPTGSLPWPSGVGSARGMQSPPGPGQLPPPWTAYGGPIGVMTTPPPLPTPPQTSYSPSYADPRLAMAKRYRFGPLGDINGRTVPFLEAFAIYLAGQVGVSMLIRALMSDPGIGWNFLVLAPVILALFWPRIRGIRGAAFRRGFGWTAPRGLLRELGSGIVGYLAGLPVFVVGVVIVMVLVKVTGASPTHPVQQAAGGGPWQVVLLFLLASVWAPIVEETFFRGALLHHLRTGWGWVVSALLSSAIFAIVHPQGWTLVPGLSALAIVFCAIREWRGSTFGGMAAHALHNGALVTVLVMAAG